MATMHVKTKCSVQLIPHPFEVYRHTLRRFQQRVAANRKTQAVNKKLDQWHHINDAIAAAAGDKAAQRRLTYRGRV